MYTIIMVLIAILTSVTLGMLCIVVVNSLHFKSLRASNMRIMPYNFNPHGLRVEAGIWDLYLDAK